MKTDRTDLPPSCRLTLRLILGGRRRLWARLIVGLHLLRCATCRADNEAWESLQPMMAGLEDRPSPSVREAVLGASRHIPHAVRKPFPAWRLALAGPALVAVSVLVCVLTRDRPDVGWNGGFVDDLAAVRVRVAALSRSVESSSTTWDGQVRRLRGRIDAIESGVLQETRDKETRL